MLGEASTTEIAKKRDTQGFADNRKASKAGGTIAGNARRALEIESGTQVSTCRNFKALPEVQAKKLPKHPHVLTENGNAGIVKNMTLTADAAGLTFNYQFTSPGDGDFIAVFSVTARRFSSRPPRNQIPLESHWPRFLWHRMPGKPVIW
jgi:hypothetical protein